MIFQRSKPMLILIMLVFVFSIVILASARGAPQDRTDAAQATATVDSPVLVKAESAPPTMTGFDVIQNLTEPRDLSIAPTIFSVDTSAKRGQSSTVDWRSGHPPNTRHLKPSPEIVYRA